MKVKVCGITEVGQMRDLQQLGVDYAGMIFYDQSKRFAGDKLKDESTTVKALSIAKVGVFVNADIEQVKTLIAEYGLTAVQLHGDETDEYCLDLMDKAKVIKVFRIADQQDINELVKPFEEVCDYYLFDTNIETYGGSGLQFNWQMIEKAVINKPFFLSGGIGIEDVEKIKAFKHPYFYGVDVNSRLELSPGIKDMQVVADFIQELNQN